MAQVIGKTKSEFVSDTADRIQQGLSEAGQGLGEGLLQASKLRESRRQANLAAEWDMINKLLSSEAYSGDVRALATDNPALFEGFLTELGTDKKKIPGILQQLQNSQQTKDQWLVSLDNEVRSGNLGKDAQMFFQQAAPTEKVSYGPRAEVAPPQQIPVPQQVPQNLNLPFALGSQPGTQQVPNNQGTTATPEMLATQGPPGFTPGVIPQAGLPIPGAPNPTSIGMQDTGTWNKGTVPGNIALKIGADGVQVGTYEEGADMTGTWSPLMDANLATTQGTKTETGGETKPALKGEYTIPLGRDAIESLVAKNKALEPSNKALQGDDRLLDMAASQIMLDNIGNADWWKRNERGLKTIVGNPEATAEHQRIVQVLKENNALNPQLSGGGQEAPGSPSVPGTQLPNANLNLAAINYRQALQDASKTNWQHERLASIRSKVGAFVPPEVEQRVQQFVSKPVVKEAVGVADSIIKEKLKNWQGPVFEMPKKDQAQLTNAFSIMTKYTVRAIEVGKGKNAATVNPITGEKLSSAKVNQLKLMAEYLNTIPPEQAARDWSDAQRPLEWQKFDQQKLTDQSEIDYRQAMIDNNKAQLDMEKQKFQNYLKEEWPLTKRATEADIQLKNATAQATMVSLMGAMGTSMEDQLFKVGPQYAESYKAALEIVKKATTEVFEVEADTDIKKRARTDAVKRLTDNALYRGASDYIANVAKALSLWGGSKDDFPMLSFVLGQLDMGKPLEPGQSVETLGALFGGGAQDLQQGSKDAQDAFR